jgi:hypothetical protein
VPQPPVTGEKALCIGVNNGSFCSKSYVNKILKDISFLKVPQIDLSESFLKEENISNPCLFEQVEEKLSNLVHQFTSVYSPLDVHNLLNLIPGYVNQALIAIRFHEKKDISNIINNIIITKISLKLKQSKEHQQLHF